MWLRRALPLLLGLAAAAEGQSSSPDAAKLVTSDIPRFWRAVDRAPGADTAALAKAFEDEYFARASPGLASFAASRIAERVEVLHALKAQGADQQRVRPAMSAKRGTPERAYYDSVVWPVVVQSASWNLARSYLTRRHYYDAIRRNTLAVSNSRAVTDSIRAAFRRMKQLYPDATFADVYFLIGRMNSGGTTGDGGLLIGTEMYGRDSSTPIGELSDWLKGVTGQAKDLPQIVAHEFVHTLQPPQPEPPTLLASALAEGSADFLAERISGGHILNPAYAYGKAHEAAVWREFRTEMDGRDTQHWLYNGSRANADRPGDLGYWVGYRIAQAYYQKSSDKGAAVREILQSRDAKALLAASGYDPR